MGSHCSVGVPASEGPLTASVHRPAWEVADVFRLFGEDYRATHGLSTDQLKVMRLIEQCRTAALGGHLDRCDVCGYELPSYNSCRNRHCPVR